MSERTDPLSAALRALRSLSDEALECVGRAMSEERERRHKERLDRARWLGTRLFVRAGRLRNKTCLVWPLGGGRFSGYYPTRCGKNGYGASPESGITCPECLAAGAEDAIRGACA